MQITAFKAILARIINIQGCEDYENTFARMESDCTLRRNQCNQRAIRLHSCDYSETLDFIVRFYRSIDVINVIEFYFSQRLWQLKLRDLSVESCEHSVIFRVACVLFSLWETIYTKHCQYIALRFFFTGTTRSRGHFASIPRYSVSLCYLPTNYSNSNHYCLQPFS